MSRKWQTDITGQKFNRLTAVKFIRSDRTYYYWLFKCDCGNTKIIRKDIVKSGGSKSCGCLNEEQLVSKENIKKLSEISTKHGMCRNGKKDKFYKTWEGMINRCIITNKKHYNRYYLRGIKVYNRWTKFENFKKDMYQPYLEHVEKFGKIDTTLDRKNNDLGYNKKNCRWATHREQMNNTKMNRMITFRNKTKTMSEWARYLEFPYYIINSRINRLNWSTNKALSLPYKQYANTK